MTFSDDGQSGFARPSTSPLTDAVPFTLARHPVPVGAVRAHEKRVTMAALLVGGGLMSPRSLELTSVVEVGWREHVLAVDDNGHPSALDIVFLHARSNDPFARGSALLPEPLQGRRFRVTATEVTPLDGATLAPEHAALVRRDIRGLGEPLFWTFCPDGAVLPGTPMPLTHTHAAAWFGHDPSFVVDAASAIYRGLGTDHAIFEGAVSFHGAPHALNLQAALSGWIGVDPRTGERVAADLSGPLQLTVTAHALGFPHPMSGQGTLSLSTRTHQKDTP